MRASISGVVTYSAVATLGYATVRVGYSLVYAQVTEPYLSGTLMPLSVAGALLATFAGALLMLAITLEVLEGIAPPRLLGRTTYTLVGSAGLLGSSSGALQTAYDIHISTGLISSYESVIVLLLVTIPTLLVSYLFWRPSVEPICRPPTTNDDGLDPQNVRQATVRQSVSNRQTCPPDSSTSEVTDSESTESVPRQSQPNQGMEVDFTELEFDWTTETDVSFDDVGGMDELKNELQRDIIKPLTTHREKAKKLGITAPNVIFHGPPGTGKTYIAEALATELELPFVKLSGANLQSKWINESATKVQKLFKEAQRVAENEGGAVVFLDELDSVLKARDGRMNSHEEDTKVVNEFLNWLETTDEYDVVFIGATNRLDSLDSAGIRSGRIDKTVRIGKPDCAARASILEAQLDDLPHNLAEEHLRAIAERTEGQTAADLSRLVEDAARLSLFERNDDKITWKDLRQALEG